MGRIDVYTMGIKFTKEEMDSMESMLNIFLENNGIKLNVPVDVFEISTKLGFDIRGAEFKNDIDGLILVNEKLDKIEPFSSNKVIAYDCKKNIYHKKFIVGHELAHYIEAKSEQPNQQVVYAARDHSEPYSMDMDEQRKDYLSAALLMPRDILMKEYSKDDVKATNEFYEEVAKKFNVSLEMTKRRIEEVFNA